MGTESDIEEPRPRFSWIRKLAIIFAGTSGFLDDLPVERCRKFEQDFYAFMDNAHPGIWEQLREKKAIDDEIRKDLEQSLKDFKERWAEEAQAAAVAA